MSREQQRDTFHEANIHIINNSPLKQSHTLDFTQFQSEDRLNDVVDLQYPWDTHGNYVFLSYAHPPQLTIICFL